MNNREQEEFVRQNRHLSLDQLASKTGLRQRNVRKLLERNSVEKGIPSHLVSAVRRKTTITPGRSSSFWFLAAAFTPALLTFLFYLPVLKNGFVNLDDHPFITNNLHIRQFNAEFFKWCFTTFYLG